MQLKPGDTLGNYKIEASIGKGGMGEVFRATDTRLNRPVAIKVSHKEFNERFEREAKAISALNHPNVCTLYDVGPNYLVMEFVEGETLSQRIAKGPLPLDKTLEYAGQITDALAAAHAKGIIHRDLKPGNIIITPNGAKVLDFGLAKLSQIGLAGATQSSEVVTMTEPITGAGSIVGTLHYMSPEQVESKEVDERSDIFAFGAVLYEMITGQRAFDGDSKAAIMAAVMKDQPASVRQLRPDAPRSLDRLVKKCLEKKPDDRWQTARDLKPTIEMIDLDAVSGSSLSAANPTGSPSSGSASGIQAVPQKNWMLPAVGALAVIAIAVMGWMLWSSPGTTDTAGQPTPQVLQFEIGTEDGASLTTTPTISPDGRRVAFIATSVDGQTQLWVRTLETMQSRPLDGTEGAKGFPFWSWDSRYLVFSNGRQVSKIEATGGPPQTLFESAGAVVSGFWTEDDRVVLAFVGTGIVEVPAAGGAPTELLNSGVFPSLLPDGRHFVYCTPQQNDIRLATLPEPDAAAAGVVEDTLLISGANVSAAHYSAGSDGTGYLLFQRGGSDTTSPTLVAQEFDADTLELKRNAVPVQEAVPPGAFSVSQTGVLVYSTAAFNLGSGLDTGSFGLLTWLDRSGEVQGTVGDPAFYTLGMRLSWDGTRVASSRDGDVWISDIVRGGATKLTFDSEHGEIGPIWSPDGTEVMYASLGWEDGLYRAFRKPSNGAGEETLVFATEGTAPYFVGDWSRDGRYLLVYDITPGNVYVLPIAEADGTSDAFIQLTNLPDADERGARWAPNGRFFSYTSNETGRDEAFVRNFDPETGSPMPGKWMVSTGGGTSPHWKADGTELYYMASNGDIMLVEVNTQGEFEHSVPKRLFRVPVPGNFWEVNGDGTEFMIPVPEGETGQVPYRVVINWASTLKN